jgi:peptidase M48-like protein
MEVEAAGTECFRFHLLVGVFVLGTLSLVGQVPEVPSQFKLDMETAARLRPKLMAESVTASTRYATGKLVFDRLLQTLPPTSNKFEWQLRIVENGQLNAYSSPDGGIYVESGLAKLAGQSSGLWAALLSHEIAHVVRRDWARRYVYEKYLERTGGATILLGDPGLPSDSWTDSEKASADFGRFCRQLEVQADRDGLMMMARAGYHPDFVPALHHLLHAEGVAAKASMYAMHPCWEERDRELTKAYTEASIEFEHRWREWYASPGGNPPVVVFADDPVLKKTGAKEWEIRVPMRCENLVGAVEVVLRADPSRKESMRLARLPETLDQDHEIRQLTGCTSPTTTVVFTLSDLNTKKAQDVRWTDLYVIDAWGSVLTRTDLPKLAR